MLAGLAVVVGLAGLVGLYLVWVGGLVILVLGVAAIISAFAYSGGPWPYGYHGLGEVFVFIFFGLVAVAGTTYLQTLTWEPLALVAADPGGRAHHGHPGGQQPARHRHRPARRQAHARGDAGAAGATKAEYDAAAGAWPTPRRSAWSSPETSRPGRAAAAGECTAGPGAAARGPRRGDPRRLNPVLKETARLSLLFAVLFAVGLAVPGLT